MYWPTVEKQIRVEGHSTRCARRRSGSLLRVEAAREPDWRLGIAAKRAARARERSSRRASASSKRGLPSRTCPGRRSGPATVSCPIASNSGAAGRAASIIASSMTRRGPHWRVTPPVSMTSGASQSPQRPGLRRSGPPPAETAPPPEVAPVAPPGQPSPPEPVARRARREPHRPDRTTSSCSKVRSRGFRICVTLFRAMWDFVRGFRALHFVGPCVTIFGSARFGESHPYYADRAGGRPARGSASALRS